MLLVRRWRYHGFWNGRVWAWVNPCAVGLHPRSLWPQAIRTARFLDGAGRDGDRSDDTLNSWVSRSATTEYLRRSPYAHRSQRFWRSCAHWNTVGIDRNAPRPCIEAPKIKNRAASVCSPPGRFVRTRNPTRLHPHPLRSRLYQLDSRAFFGSLFASNRSYAQSQRKTTLKATTFGLVRSEYVRVTVQQKLANGSVINPGGSPNPCSKEESIFYTAQCTAYSPKIAAIGNYRPISRHSFSACSNGAEINVANLSTPCASFTP